MKGWKPSESIDLEASPTWRLGAPALKRIVIRHVAEATTQELLLKKGDVDIARNLEPDQIRALSNNKDITVDSTPSGDQYYFAVSVEKASRQAQSLGSSALSDRLSRHRGHDPQGADDGAPVALASGLLGGGQ